MKQIMKKTKQNKTKLRRDKDNEEMPNTTKSNWPFLEIKHFGIFHPNEQVNSQT